MTDPADNRLQARNDLAWAISVGGIGVVLFAALLAFTWQFAATLFLIFSGVLLGVALHEALVREHPRDPVCPRGLASSLRSRAMASS